MNVTSKLIFVNDTKQVVNTTFSQLKEKNENHDCLYFFDFARH